MAIDSALKRKSVAGVVLPIFVSVTPDNTEPLDWRRSVGHSYVELLESDGWTVQVTGDEVWTLQTTADETWTVQ